MKKFSFLKKIYAYFEQMKPCRLFEISLISLGFLFATALSLALSKSAGARIFWGILTLAALMICIPSILVQWRRETEAESKRRKHGIS